VNQKIKGLLKHFVGPKATIVGVIIGILIGLYYKPFVPYASVLERSYISLIVLCLLPIIITSIILGLGKLIQDAYGRRQIARVFIVFIIGLFLASGIGLITSVAAKSQLHLAPTTKVTLGKLIQSTEDYPPTISSKKEKNTPFSKFFKTAIPRNLFSTFSQDLSLQTFITAILIGLALGVLKKDHTKKIFDIIQTFYETFETIFSWLLKLLPLGFCFLFARITANLRPEMLLSLVNLVAVIYSASFILILIYTAIMAYCRKQKMLSILNIFRKPLILTFVFQSPMLPLPIVLSIFDKMKINQKISKLVFPLGIAINKHGNVLLFATILIFLTMFYKGTLSPYDLLIIFSLSAIIGATSAGGASVLAGSLSTITLLIGIPLDTAILILIVIQPFVFPIVKVVTAMANYTSVIILANGKPRTKHE